MSPMNGGAASSESSLTGSLLELRRLVVLAEDDAHRLAHLALGGIGPRAVDQERHQVLRLVARRLGQGREPPRNQVVVAGFADLLERRDLILLDLGVDVEDRNLDLLVLLHVLVHAHDDALLLLELLLVAVARAMDLTLEVALLDAGHDTAAGVD